ncbi:hypothetical protein CYLTODRAFT_494605 [Cylindrobasidium torrendii FP15055 ss-10]|uniref:RRM domain-containing protein n=1 Tax=Cylindrobasidium torrendii FP15055 ss-10 TaxID=1314674 RepID=A0A0D7AX82_9AGAR|nr:hypothetical protein CYLTODRAFT_494605 [Cylindrobasidium torrendii FP15055 ss-10]
MLRLACLARRVSYTRPSTLLLSPSTCLRSQLICQGASCRAFSSSVTSRDLANTKAQEGGSNGAQTTESTTEIEAGVPKSGGHPLRLYIGGIPPSTTRKDLNTIFTARGIDPHRFQRKSTKSHNGEQSYGFLHFDTPAETQAFLEANTAKPLSLPRRGSTPAATLRVEPSGAQQRPGHRQARSEGPPTKTLYITPLPNHTTPADIRDAFAPFGSVARVKLRNLDEFKAPRENYLPRTTAHIEFADIEGAIALRKAAGRDWKGENETNAHRAPDAVGDAGEEVVRVLGVRIRAQYSAPPKVQA